MCLYARNHILWLPKPMVVSKVLIQGKDGGLLSPYHLFPYDLAKEYETDIHINPYFSGQEDEDIVVEAGFHFFKNDVPPTIMLKENAKIFKCIIPMGAEVYEGLDSSNFESVVSNKFRFLVD